MSADAAGLPSVIRQISTSAARAWSNSVSHAEPSTAAIASATRSAGVRFEAGSSCVTMSGKVEADDCTPLRINMRERQAILLRYIRNSENGRKFNTGPIALRWRKPFRA